jgi:hypothetical protein
MRAGGEAPESRAAFMFRLCAARDPEASELAELTSVFRDHLSSYERDMEAARQLIAVGESKPDAGLAPAQLAAWTMVANLVLNLDLVACKN